MSQARSRLRSRVVSAFAGALVLPVVILASCIDRPAPTEQVRQSSVQSSASITGTDTAWNFFSVDLNIRSEVGSRIVHPPVQLHIERRLQSDGWRTHLQFTPPSHTGEASNGEVAGADFDGAGRFIGAFDSRGRRVYLGPAEDPATNARHFSLGLAAIGFPAASARSLHPGSAGNAITPGRDNNGRTGREWLDQLVITPGSSARTLTVLRNRIGTTARDLDPNVQFLTSAGNQVIEEQFDKGVGAVVGQSLTSDGRIQVAVRKEYRRIDPLRSVLSRIVTERLTPKGTERLTVELTNLRLEGR